MVLEMYNVSATCYPIRKVLIDSTVTGNKISYFYDKFERFAKPKTVSGISTMISETKRSLHSFATFWWLKMCTAKLALTQLTVLHIFLTVHPVVSFRIPLDFHLSSFF